MAILRRLPLAAAWCALLPGFAFAQNFTPQLRTDPDTGNVLGVQRYGRQLRIDPDQGEGFTYRVYPTGFLGPATAGSPSGVPILYQPPPSVVPGPIKKLPDKEEPQKPEADKATATTPKPATAVPEQTMAQLQQTQANLQSAQALAATETLRAAATNQMRSQLPYNPTQGLRQEAAMLAAPLGTLAAIRPEPAKIDHQPLIQIKVRVIEVERSHELQAASILDYISRDFEGAPPSRIRGNNINNNRRNVRSGTRFGIPGLIALNGDGVAIGAGQGLLLNLTTEHINYILSVLQTEFRGDLITAPQVCTLNGETVEFFAGAKQPFVIGQNVVTGDTNNIQQFFYKHVGAYVCVTPNIVKWANGNRGKAPATTPMEGSCDPCQRWHPNDCTIDLAIVVRLADADKPTGVLNADGSLNLGELPFEQNVRAIANLVQVQSGQGVVMAGLIGARDERFENKVPFLGDLPGVGFLFRSQVSDRRKTETLIFVEATVLDPDPCVARQQSYQDFLLGQPYVWGETLDNPLEEGMHRAGFGPYLPPLSVHEARYWERFGRKVQKACTKLDDLLE